MTTVVNQIIIKGPADQSLAVTSSFAAKKVTASPSGYVFYVQCPYQSILEIMQSDPATLVATETRDISTMFRVWPAQFAIQTDDQFLTATVSADGTAVTITSAPVTFEIDITGINLRAVQYNEFTIGVQAL